MGYRTEARRKGLLNLYWSHTGGGSEGMPMIISGGNRHPEPTKYLFVDGAYLHRTLAKMSDRYFGGAPIDIDYDKLANGARKIFYYDCLPGRKEAEPEDDFRKRLADRSAFFEKLKDVRGWHVQLGTVKGEGDKLRQKQVDTMLSVDMLAHSYRRNASEIALIAGDLDFKPAVDALVQDGMYVILYFDKFHVSRELMASADDRRPLEIQTLRNWIEESFKAKYEIPTPHGTPDATYPGYELLRDGVLANGKWAKLYKCPEGFSLVFEQDENRGYKTHIKGKSLELIERFSEDVYQKVAWR